MKNNHHDKNVHPHFAPVTELFKLGPHLDEMLKSAEEQLGNLEEARPKPHILDNFTVNRVVEVYKKQYNDLDLFDELLRRWSAEPQLSAAQSDEIKRLQEQMIKLREAVTNILGLADELKEGTIEKILAMDEAELGLRALLGDLPGQRYQKDQQSSLKFRRRKGK